MGFRLTQSKINTCYCRQAPEGQLRAVAELVKCKAVPTQTVLAGFCYSLNLLDSETKADPESCRSALTLLASVVRDAGYSFQELHSVKTYIQQISAYLMGHVLQATWPSSLKWNRVERVCQLVLDEFICLMTGSETATETAPDVMALLDEHLPLTPGTVSQCAGCQTVWRDCQDVWCHSCDLPVAPCEEVPEVDQTVGPGWDTPLVACLADALSSTAQLSSVISCLLSHAQRNPKAETKRRAAEMLFRALRSVQNALGRAGKLPSQHLAALVFSRDLVVGSVRLLENADDEGLKGILERIVQLLQVPVGGELPPVPVQLCSFQGDSFHAVQLPSPLASLHVVAATSQVNALPTDIAVRQLFEVVAENDDDSALHRLLTSCKAEALASSNSLGLSVLLPGQQRDPEVQTLMVALNDMGEEATAQDASARFSAICAQRHNNFHALVQCMRAVGEIACMQRSAADEQIADRAFEICGRLSVEALGPAAVLFAAARGEEEEEEETFDWNDLLDAKRRLNIIFLPLSASFWTPSKSSSGSNNLSASGHGSSQCLAKLLDRPRPLLPGGRPPERQQRSKAPGFGALLRLP